MAKKPYAMRTDPLEFTVAFYERLDVTFLYGQAVTLKYAIEQGEEFKKRLEERIEEWGGIGLSDKYFESLRAQLYFMALHQFEALFALLLAPFQDIPDWVYLTEYRNDEIQNAMDLYLQHRQSEIASGVPRNQRDFVQIAVYSGFSPTDEAQAEDWQKNLDVIAWLIHRMAREYRENAAAYNSYKHGLRVMTGQTWFKFRLNNAEGNPTSTGFDRASDDSLIYLDPRKQDDHIDIFETIMHFDPEEYYVYIAMMAVLLQAIQTTRLAHFKKEASPGPLVRLSMIDTDELISTYAGKHFRSSWTV